MSRQLPLDLRWLPHQRLGAFWPGGNVAALQGVTDVARGDDDAWLYLHGARGTGKTHLLIGACRESVEAGHAARYVALATVPPPRADAIAALDARGLLAIDDVQAVAGNAAAESAMFDLCNRARDAGACMLLAAPAQPGELGIDLPDLVSRLSACTRHALRPLDDAGRRAMLRLLAGRMGLRLDEEVLDWWFARQPRDPASLVSLLQRIDRASLAAQRRVTIPFLRDLLEKS